MPYQPSANVKVQSGQPRRDLVKSIMNEIKYDYKETLKKDPSMKDFGYKSALKTEQGIREWIGQMGKQFGWNQYTLTDAEMKLLIEQLRSW